MDENPFNAGAPGAEEVDLYGTYKKTSLFRPLVIAKFVVVDKQGLPG
jgi:hypothetical protein